MFYFAQVLRFLEPPPPGTAGAPARRASASVTRNKQTYILYCKGSATAADT